MGFDYVRRSTPFAVVCLNGSTGISRQQCKLERNSYKAWKLRREPGPRMTNRRLRVTGSLSGLGCGVSAVIVEYVDVGGGMRRMSTTFNVSGPHLEHALLTYFESNKIFFRIAAATIALEALDLSTYVSRPSWLIHTSIHETVA